MFNRDSSAKLINSLASLTHRDRIFEVIKLGQESKNNANLVKLLVHK